MLLGEFSDFIRNHLHLKVRVEFGVFDMSRCINDVPNYSYTSANEDNSFRNHIR